MLKLPFLLLLPLLLVHSFAFSDSESVTRRSEALARCGPTERVIADADAYVIKQVGEQYFKDNYERVTQASKVKPCRRLYDQIVRYKYKPYFTLLEKKTFSPGNALTVTVSDCGGYAPLGFIALKEGGEIVEPRVSKSEACALAYFRLIKSGLKPKETRAEHSGRCSVAMSTENDDWEWQVHIDIEDPRGFFERLRDSLNPFSCKYKQALVRLNAVSGVANLPEILDSPWLCF